MTVHVVCCLDAMLVLMSASVLSVVRVLLAAAVAAVVRVLAPVSVSLSVSVPVVQFHAVACVHVTVR